MKGKVLDDDEPIPIKPKSKTRPTRGKTYTKHSTVHSSSAPKINSQPSSNKNPFRFPSIINEEVFESKLQEAPTAVHTKKYKLPEGAEDSLFTYSTIKFSGDDDDSDDSYVVKSKPKAPKRSTSVTPSQLFKLEQSFGGQQIRFDTEIDDVDDDAQYSPNSGFKPSPKFSKGQKSPPKLFKSTEDEFKDSEFFDFSMRPRPGQSLIVSGPGGKYEKFKTDLGVKSLAIKAHKYKFDPQLQGGFKPSFKLRDFPHIHGSDRGGGIASPGQIKTFYDDEEFDRDERIKQKLSRDTNPASKAQLQQFFRAKEDERLEKLVEEQFKLQQQKQLAQEKEVELKHQHQVLQRQKEKLKQVEKQLSNKVTRQTARQKRRPNVQNSSSPPRRQRNPNPINFSVASNGQSPIPLRSVTGKDGTYRVSFNVQ